MQAINVDSSAGHSTPAAYGLTVLLVIVAGMLRWLLDPVLGDDTPYPTFFAAVVVASRIGGWRTAALATFLGFFMAWFLFVPPRLSVFSVYASQPIGLALYLLVCILIAVIGESHRQSAEATRATLRNLGRQAEFSKNTLASIADGVITTDVTGKVMFLNPVAQKLTGWTQELAEGRSLDEVFHAIERDTRKPILNLARHAARSEAEVDLAGPIILISRNGTEWTVEDSTSPILDQHGQIQGAVVLFRELTLRQKTEELERQLGSK